MVDIATPTFGSQTPISKKTHPDEETFRVAEELMLLSASRMKTAPPSVAGRHSSTQTHTEHSKQLGKPETTQILRKRQKALSAQFDLLKSPTTAPINPTKRPRQSVDSVNEDIINSRCDATHVQLLREHRSRFIRARRRWNLERAVRHKAIVDSFQVQGIPLVQHLESLSHRR